MDVQILILQLSWVGRLNLLDHAGGVASEARTNMVHYEGLWLPIWGQ